MRFANRLRTASLMIAVFSMYVHAQLNQGSLVGQATDTSKAAVSQAEITVHNIYTGTLLRCWT